MEAPAATVRELRLADGRLGLIRRAVPDDAATALEYLRTVGSETPNLTFGAEGPGLTEQEEREYLERIAATDNALAIFALVEGRIAGGLTFEGGKRPRLRHVGEFGISVSREYAGLGVGRAMIQYMIAWAETGGVVRKINLKVRADNTRAIRLYERMGWIQEGRTTRDTFTDGRFHDCLLMGRAVDP